MNLEVTTLWHYIIIVIIIITIWRHIYRPHRLHAVHEIRSVATDVARSMVCVSVCWDSGELCKRQRCCLGTDSCGSKEPLLLDGGGGGSSLDKSICICKRWQVGDAAFFQIILETCYYYYTTSLMAQLFSDVNWAAFDCVIFVIIFLHFWTVSNFNILNTFSMLC